MGNNASLPISESTQHDFPPSQPQPKSRVKKSSLPSLPTSSIDLANPPAWRRASEPNVLPRRKSLLRKNHRRRSNAELKEEGMRPEMPRLVLGDGTKATRNSQDSYEGLMIRVGERKFSRAEPVDTEDALDALERITRAASFPLLPEKGTETGLGLMTRQEAKTGRPAVPFAFDSNYRLDSSRTTATAKHSPLLQPFPSVQQHDLAPHESPASRFPLSPISHWSDSSACGLTPPQTFQSFRNSVNLPKTINRYSNLFNSSSAESTPSPTNSSIDLPDSRLPARSRLGGMWKSQRGKKGRKGKGRGLGEIVVVKAERVGSSRYSELRAAAGSASDARSSSRSSSLHTSQDNDHEHPASSSSSSRVDRASWIRLENQANQHRPPSSTSRRISSPDPQLVNLIAASPRLAFAGPTDDIFLPFDSETPLHPVNPSPAKISTRLPSGHPAAYHHSRFTQKQHRSPPLSTRRTPSYLSAQRSSSYTNNSRCSVLSEGESTSSALQATVQQGFRTSRIGSVSVPLSELVSVDPLPQPLPVTISLVEANGASRRPSAAISIGLGLNSSNRRQSQASALSFPRSNSPECPRTIGGRKLSITSTFFGDSPSSQESTPPPVPLPPHDFTFRGCSLTTSSPRRPSRPPSLDLDRTGARSSTPNSIPPPLTSATSTTFSTRSSMDPCPSLQVPTRPHGRLCLEQPDAALSSLSKPLPSNSPLATIDFGDFSFTPKPASPPSPPPLRNSSPAAPPKLKDFHWSRASAGDARPTSSTLEDRRETYPRSPPIRSNKMNVFDTLVQQAMERENFSQRKRGLSKEEVEMWLGDAV